MPIYLVRWPGLSASLVRASDTDQLVLLLDEIGNADGCTWSVYDGPLFIDFSLPAEWSVEGAPSEGPVTLDQVVVGDIEPLVTAHVEDAMEVSFAEGDEGMESATEILRRAFPALHQAVERHLESDPNLDLHPSPPEGDLREALLEELRGLVQWSWRRAQQRRKTDRVSELAREIDMPEALARRFSELASEGPLADDENLPGAPDDD